MFILEMNRSGVLLWVFMAVLPACASQPRVEGAGASRVIVVFGDSTSAPRGGVRVFAEILKARLPDAKIINAGVAGNTTRDGLVRLDRDVISAYPYWVTIFFGINDSAVDVWKGATEPRVALGDFRANMREVVERIIAAGGHPIVLTPNPVAWTPELLKLYGKSPYEADDPDGWNVVLKQYAAAVRVIAADEHVPLVDVDEIFRTWASEPGHRLADLLCDGMHPNSHGHELIASAILAAMEARK
jgi:lysophospholipase L1-like esterase